jgi:GMP synthase-like glutamine amidotransferase
LGQRRLAGAAGGEISNAHDGKVGSMSARAHHSALCD